MSKRLLYVGHSFHQKTLSTKFLIDILELSFSVDFFWTLPASIDDDLDIEGINRGEYSVVVFFQTIPDEKYLQELSCKNLILIPMYDNDIMLTDDYWKKYINYKFICFSHSMYRRFEFLGFQNTLYLQYSPSVEKEVKLTNPKKDKFNLFFWQRSSDITWDIVKNLLDFNDINSVHMHRVSENENDDLWFQKPSEEDIINYNITFSSWFESYSELQECLKKADIFIAPRLFEGIGQAFLEAMALGKCVIAPNFPTVNEYIKDNYNGLLYSLNSIKKLDISDSLILGVNAKKSMLTIRDKWEESKNTILPFIEQQLKIVDADMKMKENIQELSSLFDAKYRFIVDEIHINKLVNSNLYKTKNKLKSLEFLKFINLLNDKLDIVPSKNKIVIYGAGTGADMLLNICGDKIDYIVDKDKDKDGTQFKGKDLFHIDKIRKTNDVTIVISLFDRVEVIEQYLLNELLIPQENIVNFDNEFDCINL